MINKTLISASLKEKFNDFKRNGRILIFEAPCGFGKTALSNALLKESSARILRLDGEYPDFDRIYQTDDWDILFFENIHLFQNNDEYRELCKIIKINPSKKFVFTTRGVISGELIPFRLSGLLIAICFSTGLLLRNILKNAKFSYPKQNLTQ